MISLLQSVHMPLQAPESYIKPYQNISASKPREKYSGMVAVLGAFRFMWLKRTLTKRVLMTHPRRDKVMLSTVLNETPIR